MKIGSGKRRTEPTLYSRSEVNSPMPIEVDQTIGPYQIVSILGRGGMATVYKAYQPALDRFVAIKVPLADFQSNPEFVASFEREIKILAKLDHPNIVPIYDVFVSEGVPLLIMRFVEGQTLQEFLKKFKKPLGLQTITLIMCAMTGALAYAHQRNILHRDVKPSNIMLGNDGNVYLMDFGLAHIVAEADLTLSSNRLVGTAAYISPEQAKGESLDERTDVYSLGVVLYEMLTGKAPFAGERASIVIYNHISTPATPPSKVNSRISPQLDQVVLKALAKERNNRYSSAPALLQAFQEAVPSVGKDALLSAGGTPAQTQNKVQERRPISQVPTRAAAKPVRRSFSLSNVVLGLAFFLLLAELVYFFPTVRSELRNTLVSFTSSTGQNSHSDLTRVVLGTASAYIATMSTHILLSKLRRRLPGVAFIFAVAFGVTLILALILGCAVLVLLNAL
jgi:serine/threonine protein kinase